MTSYSWFILGFVAGSSLIGIIVGIAAYRVKPSTVAPPCPDEVEATGLVEMPGEAPSVAVYDKPSAEQIAAARAIGLDGRCIRTVNHDEVNCEHCPVSELCTTVARTDFGSADSGFAKAARAYLAARGIPVEAD